METSIHQELNTRTTSSKHSICTTDINVMKTPDEATDCSMGKENKKLFLGVG